MSLKKRGKHYHWHEWIDGVEYRESLKTTDRNKAKEIRQDRITEIKTGKAGKLSRQHFELALKAYLENQKLHVEDKTYRNEKDRGNHLKDFFKETPLRRIMPEMIRSYQAHRHDAGKSSRTINGEVGLLRRILKQSKLWTRVADSVHKLPETTNIGKALEKEQQKALLETAATKDRWQIAYSAAVLSLNTTMRSAEIKGLQWSRVDLFNQTLLVSRKTTKTNAGERLIPLNRDAVWALSEMWNRAVTLSDGKPKPEHYVFFAFENYRFDPTRPVKSWRSAWRSLTKKAQLEGLRFHDLRHSAITTLAESGLSDQTVMSLAGHVSRKMLDHYSHIRLDAKRKAVETLGSLPAVVKHDDNEKREEQPSDIN